MSRWEQIESIYQSALGRDEGQRAAFVEATCSGDEELRREVESLLAYDASAQDFMGKSALQATAKRLAADRAHALIGRQFGAYQIVSLIGAGGMGTVYRAIDTRLNRPVAIKVLHSHLAAQAVWRQRFEREARAISNLNHPHICTLHDIGREDGSDFLVMEYLEGETLAQRLKKGCLPTDQLLRYAIEITSALDQAHLQGVIHRDVKPANIMLTKTGAKLLDFGLAKHQVLSSLIGDTTGDQATWSQDRSSEGDSITEEGMILGTLEYMAPEQVEGKEADARTDLFALGVVLYEMATGRKAFEGGSKASLAEAILTSQPAPMTSIHPVIPPALERVVNRCVAKDPEKRWQSANELVIEFRCIEESRSPGAVRAAEEMQCRSRALGLVADNRPGKEKSRLNLWSWLAIALVSAAAVAVWFHVFPPRPKASVLRPKVIPLTSFLGSEIEPALSPDGSQVAFVWNGDKGDNFDIYVQLIGAGTPLRLTSNPEREFYPTWSPDGRNVAFVRQSKAGSGIFLVPARGGHERKLADCYVTEAGVGFTGLAWSADGKFLIFVDKSAPQEPCSLFLLSIDSGERKRLTFPPGHSVGDSAPAVSPDGKTVAFCRHSNYDAGDVYIIPFAGGESKRLTFNQRIPGLTWTADGLEIVFSSSGILWRVGISGGRPEQLTELGEQVGFSSVSIRGSRLVYARTVFDSNIWRLNGRGSHLKSTQPVKLIASTRYDGNPEYSPDGERIAFVSARSGSYGPWVCDSEGHNAVALASDGKTGTMSWSPDGQRIAFDALMLGHYAIYVMNAEGGVPLPLTTEGSDNVRPSWSHDGQWIYFGSNRSGDWQVWKMPAAGGLAEQVTRQGGAVAKESPDRKFLYYSKSVVLPAIPGLWKVPLTGGEEAPVIESLRAELAGYWAMTDRGIYFVEAGSDKLTSAAPVVLSFMNFRTGRIIKITPLEGAPYYWNAGLSVSRDGRWILYGSIDRVGSDIMLVENFR